MKKAKGLVSLFLLLTIALSMIYIPTSASGGALIAGSQMLTDIVGDYSGYTAISTAEQFKAIAAGGKYYLTKDIDLTAEGVNFATLKGGNNSANVLIIDGMGHSVKTDKPLIDELPGGGAGKHSEIRNLTINGSITLTKSEIEKYSNGMSAAALVGKSNGGIYENIVNNASVTLSDEAEARVAGLVGAVFNENIYFKGCINNGDVNANVISSNGLHGVAGIVAYVGINGANDATFIDCVNNANISNTSKVAENNYAGGILAIKRYSDTSVINMCDCKNNGKISAITAYGNYSAISTYQNMNVVRTVSVSTAEEFMQISGSGAYKLTADIALTAPNSNKFSGTLYGNGYTLTAPSGPFVYGNGVTYCELDPHITCLNINGRPLNSFAVIAGSASDASAKAIVDFVKSKYNITLPIKTASENYSGDAIYINCGNTYGNVRHGFDYELTDSGYMHIYLDETDDKILAYTNGFLTEKLTTDKSEADFFDNFGQKKFSYTFPEGADQGYTFSESEDEIRMLADGVKLIKRTYHTAAEVDVYAYILILESDANAHIEVNAVELTKVDSCVNDNEENCHLWHGVGRTTSQQAADIEAQGKDVIAAINAGFFMRSAKCMAPWGMQIVNGVIDREPSTENVYDKWFGITKDGKPVISDAAGYESNYKGEILYGVGARYIGIQNGKYKKLSSAGYDARTAVGYNADGDIVLVVVPGDNEDASEYGATYASMSQIFMDLDMDITDMLNLDGGGSSTMIADNEKGAVKLESPLLSGSSERALGNILAIVAG